MRLDDDDLYDYDQDSFNEDEAIEEVIATLKPAVITDIEAETELEKTDYDIDAAIANLRKKHEKPKAAKPNTANSANPNGSKGKLSALQMLAARKNQPKLDIATKNAEGGDSSKMQEAPSAKKRKTLAEIAAERRANKSSALESNNEQTSTQPANSANATPKLSALEKLKQRKLRQQKEDGSNQQPQPTPSGNGVHASSAPQPPAQTGNNTLHAPMAKPEVSYEQINRIQHVAPSFIGEILAHETHELWNTNTNYYFEVSKNASQNFSKPSPDDMVLNAQNAGFNAGAQPRAAAAAAAAPAPAANTQANKQPKAAQQAAQQASQQATQQPKSQTAANNQPPAPKKQTAPSKSDLLQKIKSMNLKPSCSFVVIGHVDAGKSTLMGRLLLDTGSLSSKTVSKYEHESSKAGKGSFWLAWALDATKEERERGVTVDIGEAQFETESTKFTVLDAPGHKDYVPNMISGVSNADVAVLVVDSDTNAFESGFALDGQTKEHTVLARSLGIDTLLIAVNKMDNQDWSQARFNDIQVQLTEFLTKKVGYDEQKLVFIPTSGVQGQNVVKTRGPEWFKGPTVVDALEEFAKNMQSKTDASKNFRFIVSNSFVEAFQSTLTVGGRCVSGLVEPHGTVELKTAKLSADSQPLEVKQIGNGEYLKAGDQGELKLTANEEIDVKPGDVLTSLNDTLSSTTKFIAKLRLFDTPKPLLPGTKLNFHLGRIDATIKLVNIIESLDKVKAGAKQRKLRHLKKGSAARVEFELETPAVLSTPQECKELSRFVLRIDGLTIGGGVVEQTM